jgi:hypothetical protein
MDRSLTSRTGWGWLVGVALTSLVIGACGPALVARPVVPIDHVAGGGAYYVRLYETRHGDQYVAQGGKGYLAGRVGGVELTIGASSDRVGAIAIGSGVRKLWNLSERLRLGVDVDGGIVYGFLGAPVSYRFGEFAWLWARPAVAFTLAGTGGELPVGASVKIGYVLLSLHASFLAGDANVTGDDRAVRSHPRSWVGGLSTELRY